MGNIHDIVLIEKKVIFLLKIFRNLLKVGIKEENIMANFQFLSLISFFFKLFSNFLKAFVVD